MPHDPLLAARLRKAFDGRRDIQEKKMFGGYCWMLNGNMLCGVEVGRYMFRIGAEAESDALAKEGVRPMDITGRPMRGFVWVDASAADRGRLGQWIALAESFVSTLPPK